MVQESDLPVEYVEILRTHRQKLLEHFKVGERKRAYPRRYQALCKQQLPLTVANEIQRELHLEPRNKGLLLPQVSFLAKFPKFLHQEGREHLRRILTALGRIEPWPAYRQPKMQLAACLLHVLDNEEDTFFVMDGVMEKFKLEEYYTSQSDALQHDAQLIWNDLVAMWPAITSVFDKYDDDERSIFEELVSGWLLSLFAASIGSQEMKVFVPLLSYILTIDNGGGDARKGLRHAVLCAVGTSWRLFEQVRSSDDLRRVQRELVSEFAVKPVFFGLTSHKESLNSLDHAAAVGTAVMLPTGVWAGWTVGLYLAPALLPLSAPAGICGGLGMLLGGLATARGSSHASQYLARISFMAQAENYADEPREPEAEPPEPYFPEMSFILDPFQCSGSRPRPVQGPYGVRSGTVSR